MALLYLHCRLITEGSLEIGSDCILSQVHIPPTATFIPNQVRQTLLIVMFQTMLHSVLLSDGSFVTIGVGVEDDLKLSSNDPTPIKLLGAPVVSLLK